MAAPASAPPKEDTTRVRVRLNAFGAGADAFDPAHPEAAPSGFRVLTPDSAAWRELAKDLACGAVPCDAPGAFAVEVNGRGRRTYWIGFAIMTAPMLLWAAAVGRAFAKAPGWGISGPTVVTGWLLAGVVYVGLNLVWAHNFRRQVFVFAENDVWLFTRKFREYASVVETRGGILARRAAPGPYAGEAGTAYALLKKMTDRPHRPWAGADFSPAHCGWFGALLVAWAEEQLTFPASPPPAP